MSNKNQEKKPKKILTGRDFGILANKIFREAGLSEATPIGRTEPSNEVSVIFLRKNPNN